MLNESKQRKPISEKFLRDDTAGGKVLSQINPDDSPFTEKDQEALNTNKAVETYKKDVVTAPQRKRRGKPLKVDYINAVPGFVPTRSMVRLLEAAITSDKCSKKDWCDRAGIPRSTMYMWTKNPLFVEWFNKCYEQAVLQYRSEWIAIGLKKMRDDFNYWKAMGEKVFGFLEKVSVKHETEKSELEKELDRELYQLITGMNDVMKEMRSKPLRQAESDIRNVEFKVEE